MWFTRWSQDIKQTVACRGCQLANASVSWLSPLSCFAFPVPHSGSLRSCTLINYLYINICFMFCFMGEFRARELYFDVPELLILIYQFILLFFCGLPFATRSLRNSPLPQGYEYILLYFILNAWCKGRIYIFF